MILNKLDGIVTSNYKIYSFDLFDTVIFRKFFSLDEVFYLSCQYLSGFLEGSLSITSLVEERKRLTHLLKYSPELKTQEPKLADILSTLIRNHELVDSASISEIVSDTISFELSLEYSNLWVNQNFLKILRRLQTDNKHIICITDMYFDQAQIISILDVLKIRHFFHDIFVSSELGLTKQTGALFKYASRTLGVHPNKFLHIGNSVTSDIKPAITIGLNSKLFISNKQLTKAFHNENNIFSRNSLLSYAFLLNLIQKCHAKKIQKIFFLSRDATKLCRICQSLKTEYEWVSTFFSKIDICDLNISRASTAFLELDWSGDSLNKVIELYISNIGPSDFYTFMQFFNISPPVVREQNSDLKVSNWAKTIRAENTAFEDQILKSVEQKNQMVIQYLKQSGAIQSGDIAFVDIGYGGTIAKRISTYLMTHIRDNAHDMTRIHCFYLLSNNHLVANSKLAYPVAIMKTKGFLNRYSIPGILRGNGAWIESFYQDKLRGPLLEYQKAENGKITAKFSHIDNLKITEKSDIVTRMNSQISEHQVVLLSSEFQSNIVIKGFLKEMSNPSPETVGALAHCQYLSGNMDQHCHNLIKSMTFSDLLPQNIKQLISEDYWLSGSAQYSGYAWLNPTLSPILSVYYNCSQFAADFSHKVRYYLLQYGKHFAEFVLAQLGTIKAKKKP